MELNIENRNPNIIQGNIAYNDTILDGIQEFLKENLQKNYIEPSEIIQKKENYLEKQQINSDNFQRLREQVANSEQLKEQLIEEQEKNNLLNVERNKQDLSIQELKLKFGIPVDSPILPEGLPEEHLEESPKPSTEYSLLMDKLNTLISNLSHKNESPSFSSNVFDEHNKLLINKRMSDIDEKLYDLTRKLNTREPAPPINPYQYPQPPGMSPFYQPPSYIQNPFQKVAQMVTEPNNLNQNNQSEPVPNPFKQMAQMGTERVNQNSSQLDREGASSHGEDKKKDINDNFKQLLEKVSDLDQKYSSLVSSNQDQHDHTQSVPPITVNINNDLDKHNPEPEKSLKQTQNKSENQPQHLVESKEEQEEDDNIQYNFGKSSNPYEYIYNNTDDIIFEKKPILSGGTKIEKFKRLRKLK